MVGQSLEKPCSIKLSGTMIGLSRSPRNRTKKKKKKRNRFVFPKRKPRLEIAYQSPLLPSTLFRLQLQDQ
ncbi:hypothetical protein Q3G72_028565 [Acer saccharum]|nr:hypothetical protein Q3G72_028565 [Acer saccharum]